MSVLLLLIRLFTALYGWTILLIIFSLSGFTADLNIIKDFLQKNYFPKTLLDKIINKIVNLQSRVVYKFSCASCNATCSYIGETFRHFSTRVNEHLQSDKSSNVFKHLKQSQSCMNASDYHAFKIIDSAPSIHTS